MITCGRDLWAVNRRKASRNDFVERSVTTSKCTVLYVAHVNKQMYALPSSPLCCFMQKAPMKSTPVIENGSTSCTLIFGSGAASGTTCGLLPCFLQTVQRCNSFFIYWRLIGIQKDCLSADKVDPTPTWEERICTL